jgi:CHAT domain-containing protein
VGGEGGERAALGLSGMAVRAGARSAIGSLWRVHDEATARFMATFYRTLAEPGRSRAEAVRAAQQALLADPAYRHPYFWSPFLLISSWL